MLALVVISLILLFIILGGGSQKNIAKMLLLLKGADVAACHDVAFVEANSAAGDFVKLGKFHKANKIKMSAKFSKNLSSNKKST